MSAGECDLNGKVALVTGSSSGTGAAIAVELARRGARVAVHCRRALSEGESIVARIAAIGGKAMLFPVDLRDPEAAAALVCRVTERLGALGVLVNNAGPYSDTPFRSLSLSEWETVMAVNLRTPYQLAQSAITGMERMGWGRIINVSATSAYARSHSVYGLAKEALIHLTQCLALEFAPLVTVNAIVPGQIASERTNMMADYKASVVMETPMARLVTEQEVARMVAFLCTSEFSAVTGQSIVMDGGRSLPRTLKLNLTTTS
ncbi:SDR family oxidoreductase [Bradyrhizobium sp. NBAIM03]|uniref:SDR family NAD(P)-dependent oxidoreductase n=1 Tax=Bradyrhizobium sp. NBAIM03 TaxID=2793816 RepID=UPI001CD1D4B9|nr:SDR family NAD(P)-dependent oxidoreductase [Bradyrhizobium sp. NBAIM03]MCA1536807.1 SDR family oxidoreductase [Bradyrhizobium sp. NBAIM03]